MRHLIVLILLGLLIGCSHSRKLARAERKINRLAMKYPELTTPTTTYLIDTTYFEGWSADTSSDYSPGDTFVFDTGGVNVSTVVTDTIWQRVEVDSDTAIKELPCDCPPRVTVKERATFWERFYSGVIGAVIGFVLAIILAVYLKK